MPILQCLSCTAYPAIPTYARLTLAYFDARVGGRQTAFDFFDNTQGKAGWKMQEISEIFIRSQTCMF